MSTRFLPAMLVLILPPLVMTVVQQVPLHLLPTTFVQEVKPWCYARVLDKNNEPLKAPACLEPPSPVNAAEASKPSPGAGPQQATGTVPPQQAAGASGSRQSSGKTKTLPQLRAAEAKARMDFGAASSLLLLVATLAFSFAVYQLVTNWGPQTGVPGPEKWFILSTAILALCGALFYASRDWEIADFAHVLIKQIMDTAQDAGLLAPSAGASFKQLVGLNLLFAYAGAALLLSYLVALTINDAVPMAQSDRIVGLQFALGLGAGIFTLGSLANKTGLAWAISALDETQSAALIEATKGILDLWATASSVFLLTAIGTAYFGIRGVNASVGQTAAAGQQSSVVALRTPTGDDFKIFGWLVNLLIAFAPVWLTAGLSKGLDIAKTVP